MAEDSTRHLLKAFGIAMTSFEDAVAAGELEAARKAEAELREHLKGLIALIEELSEKAQKL
jgi:hypothetical protein